MFYRIVPYFTKFYRVLSRLTKFYRIYRVYRILPYYTVICRVLLIFTAFHYNIIYTVFRILSCFTEFYRILQCSNPSICKRMRRIMGSSQSAIGISGQSISDHRSVYSWGREIDVELTHVTVGLDCPQMEHPGTISGQISDNIFVRLESEEVPDLSHFEPTWPVLGPTLRSLMELQKTPHTGDLQFLVDL